MSKRNEAFCRKEKHGAEGIGRRRRRVKRMAALILTTAAMISMDLMPVLSSSGSQAITAKFDIAKELMAAVVTSIGVMVILWGIFQLGSSMQSQEGSMRTQALERIGGGLIMTLAPQLLVVLV